MVEFKNKRACVVGSRKITDTDRYIIEVIGRLLDKLGVQGASGNADGSDIEWDKHIFVQHFLPWSGHKSNKDSPERHNGDKNNQYLSLNMCPPTLLEKARSIAADHHPGWDYLKRGARLMHTRNVFQALGVKLAPETYADVTIFTSDVDRFGTVKGGTRTAVEISKSYGIPTFNLRNDSEFENLKVILESLVHG